MPLHGRWSLVALLCFRKSIDSAIKEILNRVPWEKLASVKARGIVELKLAQQIARQTKIPIPPPPSPEESTIGDAEPKAGA